MGYAAKQLMMVGLPSSGKTTYLAAFWFMVDQSTTECCLTVDKLEGERKYLNQIRDAWLEYKPVPRNLVDSQKMVTMQLKTSGNGNKVILKIPDLSGEMYRQQWSKRQLTNGYNDFLKESQGALLFIGPDVVKAHRIDMLDEISVMVPEAANPVGGTPKNWDIEQAPTQIQLIEILQAIASRDYVQPGYKLAIIISAYDLHVGTYPHPEDFVTKELPMLDQFLKSNANIFQVMAFGISAQGGVYASPMLSPEMLKHFKEFVNVLTNPSNDVQTWVSKGISQETLEAIQNSPGSDLAVELVVKDLNEILGKKDFYDELRFKSIILNPETKSLTDEFFEKEAQDSTELKILNRKLLECVFPKYISTQWEHRKEHAKLVKLPASQRVAVYGMTVKNKHDITEPVQWLMS